MKWRVEIKERVRIVFRRLLSSKRNAGKRSVSFESKDECSFMWNLVYTGPWLRPPIASFGKYDLVLMEEVKDVQTQADIIDDLITLVDHFFDELWKHVIVVTPMLHFPARSITDATWMSFRCCIRAYIRTDYPYPAASVQQHSMDLSFLTGEARKKVCPLIQ